MFLLENSWRVWCVGFLFSRVKPDLFPTSLCKLLKSLIWLRMVNIAEYCSICRVLSFCKSKWEYDQCFVTYLVCRLALLLAGLKMTLSRQHRNDGDDEDDCRRKEQWWHALGTLGPKRAGVLHLILQFRKAFQLRLRHFGRLFDDDTLQLWSIVQDNL